jgi:hypothetical protein
MPQEPALTAGEQKLDDVSNEHLRAEFSAHSPDETIVTMAANPLINQVPVMIGGDGREQVYEFYTKYFLRHPGVFGPLQRKSEAICMDGGRRPDPGKNSATL